MNDAKKMVLRLWDEKMNTPKVCALQRAINILAYEINFGPGATHGQTLDSQIKISNYIDRNFPEWFQQDLIFDDCGEVVLDKDDEPMSPDTLYELCRDDDYQFQIEQERDAEVEYSRYWEPVDEEEYNDAEEKNRHKETITDADNRNEVVQHYIFNEDKFYWDFCQYYEPQYDCYTLVERQDVIKYILGDCQELVRL